MAETKKKIYKKAMVQVPYLNVRKKPEPDAEIIEVIPQEEIKVSSYNKEWFELKNGGFVKSEFVELI